MSTSSSYQNFSDATETTLGSGTGPDWKQCQGASPNATELLRRLSELGSDTIGIVCVPPILLVIMVALYIDEILFFRRESVHWRRQVLYGWVLGVYPVLAFFNVIGLFVPTTSGIVTFGSMFYFAICLKKFFQLGLDFYGGKQGMEDAFKGEEVVSSNPFPCCFVCCCCNQPMTVSRLNILQVLVYQAIIILPLVYFVQSILAVEGFTRKPIGALALLILELVAAGSTLTALYSFVIIGKSSTVTLQQFRYRQKFLWVQLIFAFNTLQIVTLDALQTFEVLPCGFPYPDRNISFLFHSYVFTCELFLLSIGAWFAFRRSDIGCKVVMIDPKKQPFTQMTESSCYSVSSFGNTDSGSSIPSIDTKQRKTSEAACENHVDIAAV